MIIDCDLWWHMSCGRDLITGVRLDWSKMYYTPVTDSYSDMHYTWLGDCILFFTYHIGGIYGLQILRSLIIGIMCWYLWECSDKRLSFYKALIFTAVIAGAHQSQLTRNNISMLAFLPMCLYYSNENKVFKLFCTLLLWSQIHGSALLGIVISGILLMKNISNIKMIIISIILMIIIYFVLLYSGLDLIKYIKLPDHWRFLFGNTQGNISKDFMSPFLLSDRIYITVTFILSLVTLLGVQKVNVLDGIIYILTLITALGYVRMVGPHAIICGYLLLKYETKRII